MMINVREFLGENFAVEDAIVLREQIKQNLNDEVVLDFEGLDRIPSTFLTCLFSELINQNGREAIFNAINVKNLTNYNDFSRVVMGTTFLN
ncbi:STAS-like domain-containing protein [Clostridium sardiniense]|uniref:STAS-like domain-containing protein n=1 Tax=Clostridium sardiniense TaxID=29369 RepID=A0ABS7KYS8_CLOSR|nr:STAS-like domain-containing protein [Clostridium sardiniense]MBM7834021.1 anti-anti-sigma regulatory factor [Clostridium sardiniense]MBY0755968.1 STAS-like domain-containing protein [Clostridium sardiniense]MDQ0460742.1 anti-anti-sigma regulatory factor [Clostridium sardiniense]